MHESIEPLRLRRAPVVRIYDVGETTVLVGPDGDAHELAGPSAQLTRAVLAFALAPRTRAEIIAHVEALSGAPLTDAAVVDELLGLLRRLEILIPATPPRRRAAGKRPRLLLGITGAIASALTPGLVGLLQQRGFEVRIVATEAALRFVQAAALEALVHHPVRHDLWARDPALPVPHINLAAWADVVLIAPASATTIARLAAGECSTLVSAVALSTRAPVLVAPSMNLDMFAAPVLQRNLAQLVADGIHVIHPGTGRELAEAPDERVATLGPMPPHPAIVDLVEAALRIAVTRRRGAEGPPRDDAAWDAIYRTHADDELAWQRDALDDDMLAVLAREAPAGASVLDLGTGLGVGAIAAAARGCRVVATDVSEAALARAEARAGDAAIVWLRDDIAESRLRGRFEVILDRGCLHLLTAEQRPAYAAAVARLSAPGGVLVLKTHDPSEGASRSTTPHDAAAIERLLGDAFVLESDAPSTLPGPHEAPAARLFVLRRRPG